MNFHWISLFGPYCVVSIGNIKKENNLFNWKVNDTETETDLNRKMCDRLLHPEIPKIWHINRPITCKKNITTTGHY